MKKILALLIISLFMISVFIQYSYEIEFPEISKYTSVRITDVDKKSREKDFISFVNTNKISVVKIETVQYDSKIKRTFFYNKEKPDNIPTIHNVDTSFLPLKNISDLRGQFFFSKYDSKISSDLSRIGISSFDETISLTQKANYLLHTTSLAKVILLFLITIIFTQIIEILKKMRKNKLLIIEGYSFWDIGKKDFYESLCSILLVYFFTLAFLMIKNQKIAISFFTILSLIVIIAYSSLYWLIFFLLLKFSENLYTKRQSDKRRFINLIIVGNFLLCFQLVSSIDLILEQKNNFKNIEEVLDSSQIRNNFSIDLSSMIPIATQENNEVSRIIKNELINKPLRLDYFEREILHPNNTSSNIMTVNKNYFVDQSIFSSNGNKIDGNNLKTPNTSIHVLIPLNLKEDTGKIEEECKNWYNFLTNSSISPSIKVEYIKSGQITKSVSFFQDIDELTRINSVFCIINEKEISSDIFLAMVSDRQILLHNETRVIEDFENNTIKKYIYAINPVDYYLRQESYRIRTMIYVYLLSTIVLSTFLLIYYISALKMYIKYNSYGFFILKTDGFSVLQMVRKMISMNFFVNISVLFIAYFMFRIPFASCLIAAIFLIIKSIFEIVYIHQTIDNIKYEP